MPVHWNNLASPGSGWTGSINRSITLDYQYELPFAKNSHGAMKALFAGWNINGVTTIQSGLPLSIGANVNNLALGGAQRPNRVDGQNPLTEENVRERLGGNFAPQRYVNSAAFERSASHVTRSLSCAAWIAPNPPGTSTMSRGGQS